MAPRIVRWLRDAVRARLNLDVLQARDHAVLQHEEGRRSIGNVDMLVLRLREAMPLSNWRVISCVWRSLAHAAVTTNALRSHSQIHGGGSANVVFMQPGTLLVEGILTGTPVILFELTRIFETRYAVAVVSSVKHSTRRDCTLAALTIGRIVGALADFESGGF
jgi:hypothetical protein